MIGWGAGDGRDARVLATVELRVRVRAIRSNPRRLVATGFMLLAFGVVLPATLWVPATAVGRALARGEVPIGVIGAALSGTAAVALYLGGATGFNQEGAGAVGPLVRTSIPPPAVALGRLASETAEAAALFLPVAVALAVEVAVGAGGPVPALVLVTVAVPPALAALLVGRLLGAAIRYANRVLRVSLWTKAVVFVLVSIAAYAASFSLFLPDAEGAEAFRSLLGPFLPGEPVQAYASVTLSPLGATPRPLGVAVVVALLAAVPVALVAALRADTWLLLRDPGTDEAEPAGGTSRGVPRLFAASRSGRIAWRYLLRTRRDPRMLAHLTPLLFGVLGMGASVVQDPGSIFAFGPAAAVVGGSTLAGAAYCLNPLGDDRDQLPLLLTSAREPAVILRARALAGLSLGLGIVVALGAPLAVVRGSLFLGLAEGLLAVVIALAGAGTALGLGALVPRFERREYMSIERAHPSTLILLAFLFGGMVVGGVGIGLLWWTRQGAAIEVAGAVWAGYLAVLAVAGVGGYVYAVRRFERLTLDHR